MSRYLTTAEAAELAGIAPATLRRYVTTGHAPKPIRPGSGLYRRSDIERWLANRPGPGTRTDLHKKAKP